MARENLEIVRSIFEAWRRGDFDETPWAHPDIEAMIGDGPEPIAARGLAGMAGGWRDLLRAWEGFRIEAEEFRELEDGRIVVFARFAGRGRASGLDIEQVHPKGLYVFELQDGCVTRVAIYFDRARALAELGLA